MRDRGMSKTWPPGLAELAVVYRHGSADPIADADTGLMRIAARRKPAAGSGRLGLAGWLVDD